MPITETERITQAVDKLLSYNKDPFIRSFLEEQRIPVGTSKEVLAGLLPAVLDGSNPRFSTTLQDVVRHLDKIQESGAQHIFLFGPPETLTKGQLQQLQEEKYVRDLLATKHPGCGFNSDQYIWEADPPQLVEVRHDKKLLICKWVETRSWVRQQLQQQPTRQWERSVNFFRLNLDTGASELLIQKLNPNPEKKLREEMKLYLTLVKDLLDLDPVPVVLEPAMRWVLNNSKFNIRSWTVAAKGKKELLKGGQSFFELFKLKLISFVPVRIVYEHRPALVPVKMDGRKDFMETSTPSDAQEYERILTQIRRVPSDQIKDPDLKKIADMHPQWKAAIKKIDLRISNLQQTRVRSHQVVEQEWRDRKQVTAVIEDAPKTNPLRFKLSYYVRDPKTGKLVEEYDAPKSIPKHIDIERDGKVETISTSGNIWTTLHVERPAPSLSPKQRFTNLLIDKFGEEVGRVIMFPIKLVFTAVYLLLLVGIFWLMLVYLVQPFPTVRFHVYPLFALVWIVMAALYISFSQTAWDKAVDAYRKLVAPSPSAKSGKSSRGKAAGSIQTGDEDEPQNGEEIERDDEPANNVGEELQLKDESGDVETR